MYHSLLRLHGEAFESHRFEAAYHILAAALHVSEELGDPALIAEVQTLATERQKTIDLIQPNHRIASESARRRGTQPMFTTLAHTAHAAKVRTEANAAVKRRAAKG